MRPLIAFSTFLLFIAISLRAQVPASNLGAPFTATETLTSKVNGKVTVRTATIARRSDGSGYWRLIGMTVDGVPETHSTTMVLYVSPVHPKAASAVITGQHRSDATKARAHTS